MVSTRRILFVLSALGFLTTAVADNNDIINVASINNCATCTASTVLADVDDSYSCDKALDDSLSTKWSSTELGAGATLTIEFKGQAVISELDILQEPQGGQQDRGIVVAFEDGTSQQFTLTQETTNIVEKGVWGNFTLDPPINTGSIKIEVLSASPDASTAFVEVVVKATQPKVCISVGFDISKSIVEDEHKGEVAAALNEIWDSLAKHTLLSETEVVLVTFPFNEGVIFGEVKTLDSRIYCDPAQFRNAEQGTVDGIMADIRGRGNDGLTDLATVFSFVGGMNCSGGVKGVVIISDFISTQNSKMVAPNLQILKEHDVKVMAVGISKQRTESMFERVSKVDGLYADMRLANWQDAVSKAIFDMLG